VGGGYSEKWYVQILQRFLGKVFKNLVTGKYVVNNFEFKTSIEIDLKFYF